MRSAGARHERDHCLWQPRSPVGAMQGTVSSSFSMPRVAVPATLLQTAGGKHEGEIFVMERVSQHAGPETPLDMLNRAEGFFPFRPKGDHGAAAVLLVTKARTVILSVPRTTAPEDPARLSAARTGRLELMLADGSQLSGS